MKMTLEIDLGNIESIRQARGLLDFHLRQVQTLNESVENNSEDFVDNDHLNRLKEFADGLSEKQKKAWDFFLKHPGNSLGKELKEAIPELRPQGALPGVFKATQRWVTMGGDKEMCPFVAVDWSKNHVCGIYRGLTQEEIEFLTR